MSVIYESLNKNAMSLGLRLIGTMYPNIPSFSNNYT